MYISFEIRGLNCIVTGPCLVFSRVHISLSFLDSISNSFVFEMEHPLTAFFISCGRKQKYAVSSQRKKNEGGRNPEFVAFGQINEWAVNSASAAGLLRCLHHLKSVWLRAKKSEVISLRGGRERDREHCFSFNDNKP